MSPPPLTPVVRGLLIACVAVFGLQRWLYPEVEIRFALWTPGDGGLMRFRPWQLATSAFLHANWIHLAINFMVLHGFGPHMEKLLGSGRFCFLFLISAIGGSLLQLLAQDWGLSHASYSLGASAGTSGLVLAFALAWPREEILVFPMPLPLAGWIYVAVSAGISLVCGLTGTLPGIGHFAHLGGMIGGLALMLYWRPTAPKPPT